MPNKEKIKKVEILTDKFKNASALYFTKYTGMNVEQATLLRRQFADNSIEFLVSKNTLAKIACENAGFDKNLFNDFLSGQIAIAYANSDPTAPAKVIKDFSKNNDCLEVVGLYFDGEFYGSDKFKEIANLPSKEELLTKFVVALNYPMTGIVTCLNSLMLKVVNTLNALKEQKN